MEDDILKRLDDYHAAIKRLHFQTVHATLNMALTSKMLAGAVTGSFISSLIGAPLSAAIAASGGIALEVGKMALEVKKRNFELRNGLEDNPHTYIEAAKVAMTKRG